MTTSSARTVPSLPRAMSLYGSSPFLIFSLLTVWFESAVVIESQLLCGAVHSLSPSSRSSVVGRLSLATLVSASAELTLQHALCTSDHDLRS